MTALAIIGALLLGWAACDLFHGYSRLSRDVRASWRRIEEINNERK